MKKSFTTMQKVLRAFSDGKEHKVWDIVSQVKMSRPTVHKYINKLLKEKKLVKFENGSHSTYQISNEKYIPWNVWKIYRYEHDFSYRDNKILEENFFKYTPDGNILSGVQGFIYRCKQRNFDEKQAFENYKSIYETIETLYTSCGVLDATEEFSKHVELMGLSHLFYTGQYKRNEFGRSSIAEQGFYGKQTQNYDILHQVCSQAVYKIECLIKQYSITALAFTPPSLDRKVQIMDVLDSLLHHIDLPRVTLFKDYPNGIITAQKSLRKPSDRIMNAKNTIYVYDENVSQYDSVLLIDDFVGSWATLNETAKKLLDAGVKRVMWCALVWNLDFSYDVISEM